MEVIAATTVSLPQGKALPEFGRHPFSRIEVSCVCPGPENFCEKRKTVEAECNNSYAGLPRGHDIYIVVGGIILISGSYLTKMNVSLQDQALDVSQRPVLNSTLQTISVRNPATSFNTQLDVVCTFWSPGEK